MSVSKFFDIEEVTFDDQKQIFLAHMDELSSMDVREQTLYKKYYEIQADYKAWHSRASVAKARIWKPKNWLDPQSVIQEIQDLRPSIRFIEKTDRIGIDDWRTFRVFGHTANFDQNPGRFLRFFVESQDGRILGFVSLGSDVMNLGTRDKWIGWTDDQKERGMLNHTAVGTTIAPTQPFGFNFLGGKLVASLLATKYVRDVWEREYDNVLVGITTMSLYGDGSMYNSIKWWKSLGETAGKVSVKPNDDQYSIMNEIVKAKYPEIYTNMLTNDNGVVATGVKQRILNMIYKECGVTTTKYEHGFKRGVYFCSMYDNTREFLTEKIDKSQLILKENLKNDAADILDWWTPKAINRYQTLHTDSRTNQDFLFYNDAIFCSWEEFRNKYLSQVGR